MVKSKTVSVRSIVEGNTFKQIKEAIGGDDCPQDKFWAYVVEVVEKVESTYPHLTEKDIQDILLELPGTPLLEEVREKQEGVSLSNRIKRYLQTKPNKEEQRENIIEFFSSRGYTRGTVTVAVSLLLKENELWIRKRDGIKLITLQQPTVRSGDIRKMLQREHEERCHKLQIFPHNEWNKKTGGAPRGRMFGYVAPTEYGKTHLVSAVTAICLKLGLRVAIIETEAGISKYINLTNCAYTNTKIPEDANLKELDKWRTPILDAIDNHRLFIPEREPTIVLGDLLDIIKEETKKNGPFDVIIWDYLHEGLVQVTEIERGTRAPIVAQLRKIHDAFCTSEAWAKDGIEKMPAIIVILQRKDDKEEITGEAQGAWKQVFENAVMLVKSSQTHVMGEFTMINDYKVLKGKTFPNDMQSGSTFHTRVLPNTNQTISFGIGASTPNFTTGAMEWDGNKSEPKPTNEDI